MRSLTRASFALDGDIPTVALQRDANKSRRAKECPDILLQPLRRDMVPLLRAHLQDKLPMAAAFPLPKSDCGAKAVKYYLALTGDAESGLDPVPYTDEEGLRFDFQALRAQFATRLARAGVPLVTAQKMLGHSDPKLTSCHYTLHVLDDYRQAVEKLDLSAEETGGDEADSAESGA